MRSDLVFALGCKHVTNEKQREKLKFQLYFIGKPQTVPLIILLAPEAQQPLLLEKHAPSQTFIRQTLCSFNDPSIRKIYDCCSFCSSDLQYQHKDQ